MKCLFFALAAFSLMFLQASAGKPKKIAPPPPESISKVTAVNATTHEVTIDYKTSSTNAAKNTRTYTIDDISTVTINQVPAKFADIRTGMQVLGTTERDSHTLDNITLEGSGAASPAPAAKPAAKPAPKKPATGA